MKTIEELVIDNMQFTMHVKRMIEDAQKHLFVNEEPLFAAVVEVLEGGLHDRIKNGLLVVTTLRVILNQTTDSVSLQSTIRAADIISVESETKKKIFAQFGKLTITGTNQKYVINADFDYIDQIKNAIEHARILAEPRNQGNYSSLSTADELRKYKELYDSGAITKEEYEAKKQELLK